MNTVFASGSLIFWWFIFVFRTEHPIILGSSSWIYIYEKRILRDYAELNMTLHEYYRTSRLHPRRLDSQFHFQHLRQVLCLKSVWGQGQINADEVKIVCPQMTSKQRWFQVNIITKRGLNISERVQVNRTRYIATRYGVNSYLAKFNFFDHKVCTNSRFHCTFKCPMNKPPHNWCLSDWYFSNKDYLFRMPSHDLKTKMVPSKYWSKSGSTHAMSEWYKLGTEVNLSRNDAIVMIHLMTNLYAS